MQGKHVWKAIMGARISSQAGAHAWHRNFMKVAEYPSLLPFLLRTVFAVILGSRLPSFQAEPSGKAGSEGIGYLIAGVLVAQEMGDHV